ncbi:MAG: 4-hydroxy-3-methylbut-2-enyl diphosphate reductase [Aliidongia sp.]
MSLPRLSVILASPRGFCAGVARAVEIVESALARHGAPVYVRHEIVHNRFVVERLERLGAVFVNELDTVPPGATIVFSAHGVARSVVAEAAAHGLEALDATCPLVTKVHLEAQRHARSGRRLVLIGHAGHPEVEGTMGQVPPSRAVLVESVADIAALDVAPGEKLAFATQTTLSIDDTSAIVAALRARFPDIQGPQGEDICYATTNRQAAMKAMVPRVDAVIVLGAPHSSNALRLIETAQRAGCARAILLDRAEVLDWRALDGVERLGITAAASAPECLVDELIEACRARYDVCLEELSVTIEDVRFNLPRVLTA